MTTVLRSLVKISAVLFLVLWPVSALAANNSTVTTSPGSGSSSGSNPVSSPSSNGAGSAATSGSTTPGTSTNGGVTGTACDPYAQTLGSTTGAAPYTFVVAPAVTNTVTSGTTQTLCLPSASRNGDLVATLSFSPANPTTTDAFTNGIAARDAFGIDVALASDKTIVTHWTPDQCHPGYDVFTLSASQMNQSGPFFLNVKNFSGYDVGYTLTVAGPGANGIPGADVTVKTPNGCP